MLLENAVLLRAFSRSHILLSILIIALIDLPLVIVSIVVVVVVVVVAIKLRFSSQLRGTFLACSWSKPCTELACDEAPFLPLIVFQRYVEFMVLVTRVSSFPHSQHAFDSAP